MNYLAVVFVYVKSSISTFLSNKDFVIKNCFFFTFRFYSEIKKVSHYIIQDVNGLYFKIGEQRFADIPSIVEFYRKHMLDTTNLVEPVSKTFLNFVHSPSGYIFPIND